MVVALGPGKFYGSGLPRPRFYTDVRFNEERVDPPAPVLDSLMSWAEEAHWSMGGLNVKRLRFQGRIEGNINRIKAEHERSAKKKAKEAEIDRIEVVTRKRRFLVDEEEESDGDGEGENVKCGAVRKLGDDFDKVAEECGMKKEVSGISTRSRRRRSERVENDDVKLKGKKLKKEKSKGDGGIGVRVSPRLAKRV